MQKTPLPTNQKDESFQGLIFVRRCMPNSERLIANNGNLTPWVAGQSGNLNGRPVGSRTVFSQGFLKDLAEVWASHGKQTA